MFGALLSFSTLAIAARNVSEELDTFQLMFFRSVIMLAMVVTIGLLSPGGLGQFRTKNLKGHLARNCAHFVGQFGWFFGVAAIPLAQVVAIEFTTPLWIGVFAPFLLSERMTLVRGLVLLIGFSGVLVVVRPWEAEIQAGSVAVMIAAIGFALSMIATKRLTRSDSVLCILFYMGLIQAPMGLLPALGSWVMPGAEVWAWMVVISTCGMSAHFCLAKALASADALVVAPMDYLRLPAFALIGYVFFAETVGIEVVLGGLVILTSNWLNTWLEARRTRRAKATAAVAAQ
jgi:drug/metabolite transporter (DMT)-like permease